MVVVATCGCGYCGCGGGDWGGRTAVDASIEVRGGLAVAAAAVDGAWQWQGVVGVNRKSRSRRFEWWQDDSGSGSIGRVVINRKKKVMWKGKKKKKQCQYIDKHGMRGVAVAGCSRYRWKEQITAVRMVAHRACGSGHVTRHSHCHPRHPHSPPPIPNHRQAPASWPSTPGPRSPPPPGHCQLPLPVPLPVPPPLPPPLPGGGA
jgi:hypothetical protein